MNQVFISYSRRDLDFVEQLASDLKEAGLDVWYDLSGLEGGARWRIEIEKAIRESKYVIVILSPDSVVSEWVEEERLFACKLKKKIIPLFYKKCDLPLGYYTRHYIDIRGSNYRQNIDEILRSLDVKPIVQKKLPESEQEELAHEWAEEKAHQMKDRSDREAGLKVTLSKNYFQFIATLKSVLSKAVPVLRVLGILGIIAVIFWEGLRLIPRANEAIRNVNLNLTSTSLLSNTAVATTNPKDTLPSFTATPPTPLVSNLISMDFLGCTPSSEITYGMGEVTNAYFQLTNISDNDLYDICSTFFVLDESRIHQDKTICYPVFEKEHQVLLKLTVDSAYKEYNPIRLVVERNGNPILDKGYHSCPELGLFVPPSEYLLTPRPIQPESSLTPTVTSTLTVMPLLTETTDDFGVEMALVPAGEFTMGSESGYEDEKPIHNVYLDDFYIDIFEVTNNLYKACVQSGKCQSPADVNFYTNSRYGDHPVVFVDWFMASTYCDWRGARLPTEAEWEKAARGIDERLYAWGNDFNPNITNVFLSGLGGTNAVGMYELGKSPYGVYDMAGNVGEWTSSLYQPYPYNSGDGREDQFSSDQRVLRGGSFDNSDMDTRTVSRFPEDSSKADRTIGFRCAKDATP